MKKVNLIKASAFMLLATMSCNKNGVNPSVNSSTNNTGRIAVVQKIFDVTPLEIQNAILNLDNLSINNTSTQKSFIPDQDVLPDTAVWALEAALNYHFDKDPQDHETSSQMVSFDAPVTTIDGLNYLITPADLSNVYSLFKTAIQELSRGEESVKIIDITAFIDPAANKIIFDGEVIIAAKAPPVNCQALPFAPSFATSFCATAPFGDILLENRLNNCARFDCPNLYYTNVFLFQPNYNLSTSPLFKVTNVPSVCPSVSSANLGNSYNASISVATANKPTANHLATNFDIVGKQQPGTVMFTYSSWYDLKIIYGQPVCNASNPN